MPAIEVAPYGREPTLFRISLLVSVLLWLVLVVGTFGVALLYLLFLFLFYLFVQSAFISYLKGNAVEVTAAQYTSLHEHYLTCCDRLGVETPPRLYLLQSEGIVNALAARFLYRDYVVLFSSIVDPLESHPESLRFYMGHELCHVVRGHLKWSVLVWPAKLLPILGPAYARAQESSCDRYGLACAGSAKDAVRGMAVIAAGPQQWRRLNVKAFCDQADESGRFWMSFNEITGSYPWLSKRVARVIAWADGEEATFPRRHAFAWLLSAFVPNLGFGFGGGPATMIVLVAIIGILAAVAIPAYHDYTVRAQMEGVYGTGMDVAGRIEQHVESTGTVPPDLATVGIPDDYSDDVIAAIELADNGSFTLIFHGSPVIEGSTLVFNPVIDQERNVHWDCTQGGDLAAQFRPTACGR